MDVMGQAILTPSLPTPHHAGLCQACSPIGMAGVHVTSGAGTLHQNALHTEGLGNNAMGLDELILSFVPQAA